VLLLLLQPLKHGQQAHEGVKRGSCRVWVVVSFGGRQPKTRRDRTASVQILQFLLPLPLLLTQPRCSRSCRKT